MNSTSPRRRRLGRRKRSTLTGDLFGATAPAFELTADDFDDELPTVAQRLAEDLMIDANRLLGLTRAVESSRDDGARQAFAEAALGHMTKLVALADAVGLDLEAAARSLAQRAHADLS